MLMDDGRMPAYTISSPMSLQLWELKTNKKIKLLNHQNHAWQGTMESKTVTYCKGFIDKKLTEAEIIC